jgi:hypothetical protein
VKHEKEKEKRQANLDDLGVYCNSIYRVLGLYRNLAHGMAGIKGGKGEMLRKIGIVLLLIWVAWEWFMSLHFGEKERRYKKTRA